MLTTNQINHIRNAISRSSFSRTLREHWDIKQVPRNVRILDSKMLASRSMWVGQWPRDASSGRKIDGGEFVEYSGNQIVLSGDFQRFDLIAGSKDLIRADWFQLSDQPAVRGMNDFLICVGCGGHMADKGAKIDENNLAVQQEDTFLRRASRLTETEIRRLVKTVSHTSLHWLVDDPDDPMLRRLLDLGGVVHCLGGMEDFRLIHSFQKVAIGQSAFQWWAAFLGAAREIYFPPIDRGIWSHPEPADLITDPWWWGIDLRVPGDGRYVYGW